eukprot:767554-Hanusia_phi.AAC.4
MAVTEARPGGAGELLDVHDSLRHACRRGPPARVVVWGLLHRSQAGARAAHLRAASRQGEKCRDDSHARARLSLAPLHPPARLARMDDPSARCSGQRGVLLDVSDASHANHQLPEGHDQYFGFDIVSVMPMILASLVKDAHKTSKAAYQFVQTLRSSNTDDSTEKEGKLEDRREEDTKCCREGDKVSEKDVVRRFDEEDERGGDNDQGHAECELAV